MIRHPPSSTLFPYTPLSRSGPALPYYDEVGRQGYRLASEHRLAERFGVASIYRSAAERFPTLRVAFNRSEEPSELQSQSNLVCRLLLEKKKKNTECTNHRQSDHTNGT